MAETPTIPAPQLQPEEPQINGATQQQQQTADVVMTDSASQQPGLEAAAPAQEQTPLPTQQQQQQQQQAPQAPPSLPTQPSAPSPAPTPIPHATASSRNSPHPTQQAPTQPIPHGSPTRVYLNQHVTPHLLEAMKHLATTEPEKPLKWLSEFLAKKSAEIEGP